MQIVSLGDTQNIGLTFYANCLGDNLHEMPKPIFRENNKIIITNLSSAEFSQESDDLLHSLR